MEPLEEYRSPFDFEQGVNASYLYLSPALGDTPPSSPAVATRGNHEVRACVCVVGTTFSADFGSDGAPKTPGSVSERSRWRRCHAFVPPP